MIHKAKLQFTRLMLLIVCSLGVISILSLINDPLPTENLDFANVEPGQLPQRQLASILDSAHASEILPVNDVINVECDNENQKNEVTLTRIRLHGQSCLRQPSSLAKADAKESTQVRNISNGFVATVFHLPPTNFTTDYINLSEGKNEIEVVFQVGEVVTTRKMIIDRKVASIKK